MMKLENNGDNAILIADACNAVARTGLRFLNPGDKIVWSSEEINRPFDALFDVLENGQPNALMDLTQGLQGLSFELFVAMARVQDSMPENLYELFAKTLTGQTSIIPGDEYKVVGFRQLTDEQLDVVDTAKTWLGVSPEHAEMIARDMEIEAADGSRIFISSGATFMRGCTINGKINHEVVGAAEKEARQ